VVAYAALRELIPVFPVYALLFTDAGLSTGQVSTLLVIWSATHVLLEVPSGAWADTVSRRRLLVLASALYGCCFALWSAVPTYAAFAGGFVLWGLSGSLVSGTYEAYVYDHLHARGAQASYRRVIAAGETSALVLNLVATAAATPIVAAWGLAGAGWVSVAVCAAATALALWLPHDAPRSHLEPEAPTSDRPDEPDLTYLGMLRTGFAESLHPSVARAVLLAAGVPAFLAFDEYFGLLADDLDVPLTVIPLLVALTVAAQAVGSALAPRLPMHRLGPVLVGAGLLVAGGAAVQRPAGFLAVAAGYGALQAAIVVAQTDLQHRIHGAARATVTSVSGLLSDVGAIALYAFVAVGSGFAAMPALIAALALVVVALGLSAIRVYPETWRKPSDSPGRS
jgi:MFS family permease